MSIEEIKERLANASGEHGWYVMHDTDITYEEPAGSCDEHQVCVISNLDDAEFVGHAKNDIKYLLSIIEQQKKSFQEIYNLFGYVDFKSLESVAKGYEIAKNAIKEENK